MTRTKLRDRTLPDYTRGEELFNAASHLFGALLGAVGFLFCLVAASGADDPVETVCAVIYGLSLVLLYSVSGVYHGLPAALPTAKKVMQVVDHCTIYYLIAGTYTPIVLCALRRVAPVRALVTFCVVWGLAVVATVFTAIDLKKTAVFSMCCYIGMGWCIILSIRETVAAMTLPGFLWLLAGGLAYTAGAVLYVIGARRRWMHSVFHVFVIAGSALQFVSILLYVF